MIRVRFPLLYLIFFLIARWRPPPGHDRHIGAPRASRRGSTSTRFRDRHPHGFRYPLPLGLLGPPRRRRRRPEPCSPSSCSLRSLPTGKPVPPAQQASPPGSTLRVRAVFDLRATSSSRSTGSTLSTPHSLCFLVSPTLPTDTSCPTLHPSSHPSTCTPFGHAVSQCTWRLCSHLSYHRSHSPLAHCSLSRVRS